MMTVIHRRGAQQFVAKYHSRRNSSRRVAEYIIGVRDTVSPAPRRASGDLRLHVLAVAVSPPTELIAAQNKMSSVSRGARAAARSLRQPTKVQSRRYASHGHGHSSGSAYDAPSGSTGSEGFGVGREHAAELIH